MTDPLIGNSRVIGKDDRTQAWLNAHPYISANTNDDLGIAARLYSLCLLVLRQICRQGERGLSTGNGSTMLKEELGKLYLWGQAFGGGKLDRALEYSDEVRSNILESLGDIGGLLLREVSPPVTSIFESRPFTKSIQELKNLTQQSKEITISINKRAVRGAGLDDGGSDTDEDDISEDDDIGDIVEELRLQIRWLMQLAPTLEQNLIHAENTRFQASSPTGLPFSVSGPAAVYVSLVREKYRQAETQLVERLGEANWQRHVGVRNRMEAETAVPAEELVVAKSVFRPHSAFHDSGIGTSILAQTQYTPSHTSFQSSNTEGEHESLRVPATPAEVHDGIPFQCSICKSMVTNIKTRVDWKMHVFSDLQPYICTFPNCEDELVQFSSRAAWADHEFSKHRNTRLWTCPDCPQEFHEVSGWEQHLLERHCLLFSGPNLQVAKNMALKTEAKCTENDECPLCRIVVGKPRRGFVKHVGRHMEEIALMALPRDVEDSTEEESSSSELSAEENKDEHLSGPDVASIKAVHKAEGPERASLINKTNSHSPPATLPKTTTTSDELPDYYDYFQAPTQPWQPPFTSPLSPIHSTSYLPPHTIRPSTTGLASAPKNMIDTPDQGSIVYVPDDERLGTRAQKCTSIASLRAEERNESIDTTATYNDDGEYTLANLDPDYRFEITRGSLPMPRNAGPASKQPSPALPNHNLNKIDHNPTSLIDPSSRKASRSDLVNQLIPTEDGYNPIAYNREGESNSLPTEELPGDSTASSDIFCLPHRGEIQLMLATKGAAILGYRSVDLFFSQNKSLDKIIATQQDKDELSAQNILPYAHQSQEVAIVSAKSVSHLTSGAEVFGSLTSSSVIMPQDYFHLPPSSPSSSTTVLECPACSKVFRGNLSDAISNLQRHLRTSGRHNKKPTGLKCPMEECRDKARMRSDNLGTHLLNVHQIGSVEERRTIIAQCRAEARNVDSDRNRR